MLAFVERVSVVYRGPSWPLALALLSCSQGSYPDPPGAGADDIDPEILQAVQEARAGVLADPGDLEKRLELAMVLDANELNAPAEQAWLQVCTLAPDNAEAWYGLSWVRERTGDPEGSLAACERCVALAPDYSPAQVRLGRLLLASGRPAEAEAAFRRAMRLEPESAQGPLGLARLHLEADEIDEAILVLEEVVARNPEEPAAHGLLARAYQRRGDEERAREHARAELSSGSARIDDPWANRVQRRSTGLATRLARTQHLVRKGDAEGARRELTALRAGRYAHDSVLERICSTYLALGDPREALEALDESGAGSGRSPGLGLCRARALMLLEEAEQALAEIDGVLAQEPTRSEALALRGWILFGLGRAREAADALAAARDHGESSLSALLTLGRALTQAGDLEQAEKALDETARWYPEAPKPWACRAEVLALLGRHEQARDSLAKACRLGLVPDQIRAVTERLQQLEAEPGPEHP